MLRLWLGGAVCLSCIATGWWWRMRYRKRADVWQDFVRFLLYADEQIQYRLTPLPAICADYAALYPTPFARAISHYPEVSTLPYVPPDQWQEIVALLTALGRSDADGQAMQMAYARQEAQKFCDMARSACHAKGDLYAKLCVVLGLGLMIWMV